MQSDDLLNEDLESEDLENENTDDTVSEKEYKTAVYAASKEDADKRTDVFLSEKTTLTRTRIQNLIQKGRIDCSGRPVKAKSKVREGDVFTLRYEKARDPDVLPENIPLDIVYEDGDIIIINKQRGLTVHPAHGNENGTLVNALLYHCTDLSDINGVIRPGIVHRIDKDTTGLLAVAKNNAAHLALAEQLKTHSMKRDYLAIVEGVIHENSATVNAPIGRHKTDRKKMAVNTENGREAVTHFTVMERFKDATLVKCSLETGRTHQIRVHMAYIGHPVCADPLYGMRVKRDIDGQALHAFKLTLTHPGTGRLMTFEAEPPEDFKRLLEELRRQKLGN